MKPPRDEVDTGLRDLLEQALAELHAGGETRLAAFLARHDARASDLRRLLGDLRERGLLEDGPPRELLLPERLGEFRIGAKLGAGGMGVVFLAEQEPLRRTVALKVLHPTHLYSPHARERFRREIDAVARLEHPGIVRVLGVGEEQGLPWFAMERIEGCTLADALRALQGRDPRSLTGADLRAAIAAAGARGEDDPAAERTFGGDFTSACLELVRQVAEALAHAHARGVLHRDVKPSNVMVGGDGRARLVDFGLAALEGATKLTRTGANPGSLPYMSPEQIDGAAAPDARTDVYSLGVTLYELLALAPAYDSESSEATRRRILAGDVAPPRTRHPGLPRDVETVCLKAMQVEPGRRYESAAAMARDLEAARTGEPVAARRPGPLTRLVFAARRRPARALAAACVVLAATAVAVAWEWRAADERADVQRSLRSILAASFEGAEPEDADVQAVARFLPESGRERALALLRGDPLSKERWLELRRLLPESLRAEQPGSVATEAAEGAGIASTLTREIEPADEAAVMPEDVARIETGDLALDALVRAAVLLERGQPGPALLELARSPTHPSAGLRAARLALEGRARALLGDVEGFLRCRGEAEEAAAARARD